MQLKKSLPSADELLSMPIESVAPLLLQALKSAEQQPTGFVNFVWLSSGGEAVIDFAGEDEPSRLKVSIKLAEAWSWLASEALLVPTPDQPGGNGWYFISERGKELLDSTDKNTYIYGKLIPAGTLDPILSQKVRAPFLAGDYDTAVFCAFKEVEVRVRKYGGFPNSLYGVDLMRDAFNPNEAKRGPLVDDAAEPGEQTAMMNLFLGAIGLYKNPSSHRYLGITDPHETASLIYMANNLMIILGKQYETLQRKKKAEKFAESFKEWGNLAKG